MSQASRTTYERSCPELALRGAVSNDRDGLLREDGESVMACAYPNRDGDKGMVAIALDWTMPMLRCGLVRAEALRLLSDPDAQPRARNRFECGHPPQASRPVRIRGAGEYAPQPHPKRGKADMSHHFPEGGPSPLWKRIS